MKRLTHFALFAIAIFFFACTEKGTGSAAGSTTDKSAGADLLSSNREMYRAIETGDSATIRKHVASDAVDHEGGPNGEDLKGDEIVRALTSVHRDIDNLKFEVIEDAASDDHIFALVHMTGTTNKPVWGMPANHKIDSRSVDVIKVKDGKMSDHWGFYSMSEMMKMMGGGKPESGATVMDTVRQQ
jgi:predicted ester cyclase